MKDRLRNIAKRLLISFIVFVLVTFSSVKISFAQPVEKCSECATGKTCKVSTINGAKLYTCVDTDSALCGGMSCASGFSCQKNPLTGSESCVSSSGGVDIGEAFKIKGDQGIKGAKGYNNLGEFVSSTIVPNVMMAANIILFLMILGAGFTIITSAGEPDKQKKSGQVLTFSILGFIIIFAAYWIMQILGIITTGDSSGLF